VGSSELRESRDEELPLTFPESELARKQADEAAWGNDQVKSVTDVRNAMGDGNVELDTHAAETATPELTREVIDNAAWGSAEVDNAPNGVSENAHATREERMATARHAAEQAFGRDAAKQPVHLEVRPPLADETVYERTSENRINLADNVPSVKEKGTFGGYLDVVMHGNAGGTASFVNGHSTEFSLEQTAQLVKRSPSWQHRPVRLLSCSTGQGDYAQDLANCLEVPVYAPTDILQLDADGSSEILNDGVWKRFEPMFKRSIE
jgi:hypothetical protein